MPNLYILQPLDGAGLTGSDFLAVVHVTIPGGNNSVGNSYQTCLANSALGASPVQVNGTFNSVGFQGTAGVTILPTGTGPGEISSADKASIAAGTIFEVVTTMRPTSAVLATVQAQIAAWATSIQTAVLTILENSLSFYGYSE